MTPMLCIYPVLSKMVTVTIYVPADARRGADGVGELGGRVDFPEREIGGLADFERAVRRLQAERAGGVDGETGERFVGCQVKERAGHVHGEERRAERRGARIVIGGERDRHMVSPQRRDRRQARLAQEIERPGKKHRRPAGARERPPAARPARASSSTPCSFESSSCSSESA